MKMLKTMEQMIEIRKMAVIIGIQIVKVRKKITKTESSGRVERLLSRGQAIRSKRGKIGGKGGAEGGRWDKGGLESRIAPESACRHAVMWPPSP